MIEYSITIKDEDTRIVKHDFENTELVLNRNDPFLKEKVNACYDRYVREASSQGKTVGETDITVKAKLVW